MLNLKISQNQYTTGYGNAPRKLKVLINKGLLAFFVAPPTVFALAKSTIF